MPKKILEIKKNIPAEPEPVESDAYEAYKKLIEVYKKQNPVKYEAKKAALEAKLESLR